MELYSTDTRLIAGYNAIFNKGLPGKKTALAFQLDRWVGLMLDLQLAAQIPLVQP